MLENGLLMGKSECYYNARTKYYLDENGNAVPYEIMVCSRPVFSDGAELSEYSLDLMERLEYREAAAELFGGKLPNGGGYKSVPATKQECLDASRRRGRRKIFDYVICNDFDCFVTLTLDKNQIDRGDYGAVIKKLNSFLGNRVKRKGLKYVGVPEYHKNGGLHFHFAATAAAFKLVDSGTVAVAGNKRPMRTSTADRKGIPKEDRHTVYNIADWRLGFSTCIMTYGERGALATYLSKELCKDVQKSLVVGGDIEKIGGRWYLHGGQLRKPLVTYTNVGYYDVTGESYTQATDGGDFKVFKLGRNGEVLR